MEQHLPFGLMLFQLGSVTAQTALSWITELGNGTTTGHLCFCRFMTGWGKGVCLAIHDGAPSKLLSKLSSSCILKLHNHVNTAVANQKLEGGRSGMNNSLTKFIWLCCFQNKGWYGLGR